MFSWGSFCGKRIRRDAPSLCFQMPLRMETIELSSRPLTALPNAKLQAFLCWKQMQTRRKPQHMARLCWSFFLAKSEWAHPIQVILCYSSNKWSTVEIVCVSPQSSVLKTDYNWGFLELPHDVVTVSWPSSLYQVQVSSAFFHTSLVPIFTAFSNFKSVYLFVYLFLFWLGQQQ